MKTVQNLGFKIGSNQRNGKTNRSVAIYDKAQRRSVHAARSAHRERLQQLIIASQDY